MIGELSILSEWIPEQMEPGTIFVLENAGEVGEKDDPYWAVLACPTCGQLGLVTRKQIGGSAAGHLRLRALLGAVLHPRRGDHAAQAQLTAGGLVPSASRSDLPRHGFGCAFCFYLFANSPKESFLVLHHCVCPSGVSCWHRFALYFATICNWGNLKLHISKPP